MVYCKVTYSLSKLLGGQQVRLLQGALPWKSMVSADSGGVMYRKWRSKTEKNRPWFGGFSANSILQLKNKGELPSTDIEDLVSSCVSLYDTPATSQFRPRKRMPLIPPTYYYYLVLIIILIIFTATILTYFGIINF